jgi:hypothetical protein
MTVLAASRADLLRLRHWPTMWVLAGVWTALSTMFSFAFPYMAYRSDDTATAFQGGGNPEDVLASMLPSSLPALIVAGTPMFGGAIVMILGALSAGSGYGWGTWKTVFTQGPSRVSAFSGTIASVGLFVVALMAWTVCLDVGLSCLVAVAEGRDIAFAGLGDIARAAGGATLILGMWAAAGVLLGTLTRGPAMSVGLGLVWTFVVENLLRGAANLLDWLAVLTDRLPGTAAGSLAGAIGATAEGPDATPGVLTVLSGPTAALFVAVYLVLFVGLAVVLVRRRDLS